MNPFHRRCQAAAISIVCAYMLTTGVCAADAPRDHSAASERLYLAAPAKKQAMIRRATLDELKSMAEKSKDNLWKIAGQEKRDVKLYLHWSAKHYGQFYDAYHINIDAGGEIYVTTDDLSEVKGHTYLRNKGSVGIALSCGEGAKVFDLGKEPPTPPQIEAMAKIVALLANEFSIPIDIDHVLTHGEAGDNEDMLFPPYAYNGRPYGMYGQNHSRERWDLAILKNGDPWGSGGDILRDKAARYLKQMNQ